MKKFFVIMIALLFMGGINSVFSLSPPNPIPSSWEEQFDDNYIATSGVGGTGFLTGDEGNDFSDDNETVVVYSHGYTGSARYRLYLSQSDANLTYNDIAGGDKKYSSGNILIEFTPNDYCNFGFDNAEPCDDDGGDCLSPNYRYKIRVHEVNILYNVSTYIDLWFRDDD